MAVTDAERGRQAITHFEIVESLPPGPEPLAALVRCTLETGRTHQIRVHFSAVRHPCVGDVMYGADPRLSARLGLTRQWLHAVRLAFDHPAGGRVEFASTYPEDLSRALATLEAES
jgi:23S rRNA pseudouridine1911/1915/1917 synthase